MVKVKKRSILSMLLLLCSLVSANVARASCIQTGKIVRLNGSPGGVGTVELAPSTVDITSFVTFYSVPNDRYFSILASAEGAHMTVVLYGNAASCAPTGVFRPGGTLFFVDIQRNR